MSKAFTKDDDADPPPVVPPRAPLPPGVPNYVTPRGFAALRAELAELLQNRAMLDAHSGERSPTDNVLLARITELEGRIGSAELVSAPESASARAEVRFGASVKVRDAHGALRTYRIVGVDEANASEGRLAFTAPLSRALLGKRVGDAATVHTPHGDEELELLELLYDPSPELRT